MRPPSSTRLQRLVLLLLSLACAGVACHRASGSAPSGVIINEVLANELGSDTSTEFVELLNTSDAPVTLSGWTISDRSAVRHVFAAETVLAAGDVLVVFGNKTGIPAGLGAAALESSTGELSLGNGGDAVILRETGGAIVDQISYDTTLSGSDGVSMNRNPDGAPGAPFALHTALSTLLSSPGRRVDGTRFVPPPPGEDAGPPGPDAGPPGPDAAHFVFEPDAGRSAPGNVRIMAANLSSGNRQTYDPGEGIRIFQALRPDVVLLEEFNYGADPVLTARDFVDGAFGTAFEYTRGSGALPNGIVSRFPILESGEWTDSSVGNRSFVWARLDVPGTPDLWAVALHLLTTNPTLRSSEASELVAMIKQKIPTGDLLAIGGDLNTKSRTEGCILTLGQVVDVGGPYPVDQANNGNTNLARDEPYDWVLVDSDLKKLQAPVVVGASSFPAGLVFDTRVYSPLADVPPVLSTDSAAPNMQHMAVVRDFLLPP